MRPEIKVRRCRGGRLAGLVLGMALALVGSAAAERPGGFRVLGPGGGGAMFHPTISPIDPQTVLESSDMSGSYITHNGGQSWRMINFRGVVSGFAFDPVNPKVMYAAGTGLWQSTDGGATWNLLIPNPAKVRGYFGASDDGGVDGFALWDPRTGTMGNPGRASAVTVDPADPQWIWVVIGGGLRHTRDGGKHWTNDDTINAQVDHIAVVHPNGGHAAPKVLMTGPDGVWLSRGRNPLQLASPLGSPTMRYADVDVVGNRVLVLAAAQGVLFR
jgi:hypothetical protein